MNEFARVGLEFVSVFYVRVAKERERTRAFGSPYSLLKRAIEIKRVCEKAHVLLLGAHFTHCFFLYAHKVHRCAFPQKDEIFVGKSEMADVRLRCERTG